MDKMLLIIWGIYLSVRHRLWLSLTPLESRESRHTRTKAIWANGLWMHTSLTQTKSKNKQQHTQVSQAVISQTMKAALHFYLTLKSSQSEEQKTLLIQFYCEYSSYSLAEFVSSLQDVWIGQSHGVKIAGKRVHSSRMEWHILYSIWITNWNRSDGGCKDASHWKQLTL